MANIQNYLLAAGLALGTVGGLSGGASAMPMKGLDPAIATSADVAQGVENVRWICPPYRRCFWAPGPYYGPRYGWHGGWHGGWHRWHRW